MLPAPEPSSQPFLVSTAAQGLVFRASGAWRGPAELLSTMVTAVLSITCGAGLFFLSFLYPSFPESLYFPPICKKYAY